MTEPKLVLTPRRPALIAGFDNEVDVLVRLQAPETPAHVRRAPLNLALVVDRSGSMSGRPLDEAKRCADFVIDRLGAGDHACVVAYDSDVSVVMPAGPVADHAAFHRAIAEIDCRGMTALHDGWLAGAHQVAGLTRPDTVTRVLLLSDGQANEGLTDPDAIADQCGELAGAGVSTSTYGLGQGFNENLMIAMARSGQGSAYYGETAEDLMEPFQQEFDLLSALCARQVEMRVDAPDSVEIKVLNRLTRSPSGAWRLSDLAHEAEAWALLRLRVPAAVAVDAEGGPIGIVRVTMTWRDLQGQGHEASSGLLSLPALPSSAWHAIAEDALVARRAGEVEAARLQERAQAAARRGDWVAVRASVADMRRRAGDNAWLVAVADKLERLAENADERMFSKEAGFASRVMDSRLAMMSEEVADFDAVAQPSYLRRKAEQGKRRVPGKP